jgi:AcrR family transcriptional regulator
VDAARRVVGSVGGRREEIFLAAAEMFWEKGYHATSMSDIAAAMNMRKASIYHHIQSKETLLYEMSISSMRHIREAAESVGDSDPERRLRGMIVEHVAALLDDRSKHATALVEMRSLSPVERREIVALRDGYDALFDGAVAAVQEQSGRWPGIAPHLVRLALLGMLNWSVFWYSPDGPDSAETVGESFADIFLPPLG